MVFFKDDGHRYFNEKGEKYTSVSNIVEPYCKDFNSEKTSIMRLIRDYDEKIYQNAKKYFRYDDPELLPFLIRTMNFADPALMEEILKTEKDLLKTAWSKKGIESAGEGTEFHLERENDAVKKGYLINPLTGTKHIVVPRPTSADYDNKYILDELKTMTKPFVVLECLLKNDDERDAGQSDIVFFTPVRLNQWGGKFNATIGDYKSDKVLETQSFFDGTGYKMMKGCLSHVQNCNVNVYTLKMSFYAYMLKLERIYTDGMFLHHIPKDKDESFMKLPVQLKNVELVLEERQINHSVRG